MKEKIRIKKLINLNIMIKHATMCVHLLCVCTREQYFECIFYSSFSSSSERRQTSIFTHNFKLEHQQSKEKKNIEQTKRDRVQLNVWTKERRGGSWRLYEIYWTFSNREFHYTFLCDTELCSLFNLLFFCFSFVSFKYGTKKPKPKKKKKTWLCAASEGGINFLFKSLILSLLVQHFQ